MSTAEPVSVPWTQQDAEREHEAFEKWWKERGYEDYPDCYSLTCQNAMHAAWQEASRLSALSHVQAPADAVGEPVAYRWKYKKDTRWNYSPNEQTDNDPAVFEQQPLYAAALAPQVVKGGNLND